ncbi:MAG: M14 family zinc carboxypeptidase [Caldisericia bacterium]
MKNIKKIVLVITIISIIPVISFVKGKSTYSLILTKEKIESPSLELIQKSNDGYLYLWNGIGNLNVPYTFLRTIREGSEGYNTFETVKEKLKFYEENYKDIVELTSVGKTSELRDIYLLKISKKSKDYKPSILIVGCHHAREWMSVEIVMKIIDYLLSNYDKDEKVKYWIDNFDIFIIPILNPDGFVYSIESDRMWRKNRVINFDGSRGVDNNRNYGYKWGISDGSSSIPSSETYRGKAPFSELENQALRDFVYENPPSLNLSYHSFSELILYPWGYTNEPPPDKDLLEQIAVSMAKTTGAPNDNDYPGPYDYYPMQSSGLYTTSGDLTDFLYGEMGTFSYTVELNSSYEFFDPPPELIEPTWEQTKGIFLVAMNYVDKFGLLSLKIVDKDGNPYDGDVYIIEKNIKRKTQKPGIFNYFLTEGEYTISIQGKKFKVKIKPPEKNEVLINLGEIYVNPAFLNFGEIEYKDLINFEFEVEGEGKIEAPEEITLSKYEFSGKEKISGFIKIEEPIYDKDYEFIIKITGKSDTKEVLIKFKFIIDTAPPEIKFNIDENYLTNKNKITIFGETEKDAKVYLFNDEIELDENGRFSVDINLNEGLNEIKFTSIDKFWNSKEYILKITCDLTPPKVEINIPDTYKVISDNLTINGKVSEKVNIYVNDIDYGLFEEGDFEITFPIDNGINKLNIEVVDLAKNKTSFYKTIYKVEKKVIELFIGSKKIFINGIEKEVDTSPFILNGRCYVPIRFITEALGGNISYNEVDKSISFTLFDKTVLMWVDKKNYFVNFKEYFMDSAPFIVKPGRVMVPLRFIVEAVDAKVLWEDTLKKITVLFPNFNEL